MTSIALPPWLDQNPVANLDAAAGIGSDIGARKAQLNLAAIGQQQQQQSEQQRLQLAQQAQQEQAAEAQKQIQIQQQRQQVETAEAKMNMNMAWQNAATKFAAQQQYQNYINNGGDPIEGLMKFGPQMGESLTGLGSLSVAQSRDKMLAQMPQPVFGEDGTQTGTQYNGRIYTMPKQTSGTDTLVKTQYSELLKQRDALQKQLTGMAVPVGPGGVGLNQTQMALVKGQLDGANAAIAAFEQAHPELKNQTQQPAPATTPYSGSYTTPQGSFNLPQISTPPDATTNAPAGSFTVGDYTVTPVGQ